jgi:hypothetical protein
MMYCYNEKTVDVKRGKRGKTIVFPNILSWQVLGGRGCRRVWCRWGERKLRMKAGVLFLAFRWVRRGRGRRRRICVVARDVDECLKRFCGARGCIWRLCNIRKRHLFTRVQRKNKGLVRVGKGGEDLGGTVEKRSSEDKEGSCCVPCVVCVLPSSLLPLFQHIFGFLFRRRARRNQGLVCVENVANMALGFLASLLSSLESSLYGPSVLFCLRYVCL